MRDAIRTWFGQLISNFGDTLHDIALVVLVFQLTGHGLAVAGLAAAEMVPVLAYSRYGRTAPQTRISGGRMCRTTFYEWPQSRALL